MGVAIEKFLFNHRNLPCTETKIVPSPLMFSFKPRCPITILKEKPSVKVRIEKNIELEKPKKRVTINVEKKSKENCRSNLNFKKNEEVLYISKTTGYCYATKAKIFKQLSENVFEINVKGLVKTAHKNQLRKSILKKSLFNSF